ncbi:uncharacterized protein [Rutidosis leptorrhynchoides]|uniref:uncharacterized protein n=1 Tax=Rutidosis leptorrhynchoides TaxID=125765 RepID=UPI003A9922E2
MGGLIEQGKVPELRDGVPNSLLENCILEPMRDIGYVLRDRDIDVCAYTENPCEVKGAVFEHFRKQFSRPNSFTSRPTLSGWAENAGMLLTQLSDSQNSELEGRFFETEVWNAIKDCGNHKASGPDGFNITFYKKFWSMIKGDLMNALNDFWLKGELSHGCNASFITLIPKKVDPLSLNEYWPISLIGSFYKKWILSCLKSASISILVNGSPTNEFTLQRGVRQGDPLSPFLFILAAEGLNLLAKAAVRNTMFEGVEIGVEKIPISHLQYADDTIFFARGVGLPIGAKISKEVSWKSVIDKFEKRLADWRARSVSFGGRLTLVKSVLNSFPLYFFSLFRAPQCVLKKLECVRRSFFWGGSGNNAKISWVKWDEVILSFEEGGLNLGSLKNNNLALIGKWRWRFKIKPTSLWVRVIKSFYGISGGLDSGGHHFSSNYASVWSSIIRTVTSIEEDGVEFKNSFCRDIGEESNTAFWLDNWISNEPLYLKFNRLYRLETNQQSMVIDRVGWNGLSCEGNWHWKRRHGRLIGDLNELHNLIRGVKIKTEYSDSWRWTSSRHGKFETRLLSDALNSSMTPTGINRFETLRNNLVPKKVEDFVWRARKKRLPVLTELDKRGLDLNSVRCPICDNDIESVDHSLVYCNRSLEIWSKILEWWGFNGSNITSLGDIFDVTSGNSMSTLGAKVWQAVRWSSAYLIWKNRNQKVFKNESWNTPVAICEIQVASYDWIAKRCKSKTSIDWHNWLHNPKSFLNM